MAERSNFHILLNIKAINQYMSIYIYIYIYMCVCVCVCVIIFVSRLKLAISRANLTWIFIQCKLCEILRNYRLVIYKCFINCFTFFLSIQSIQSQLNIKFWGPFLNHKYLCIFFYDKSNYLWPAVNIWQVQLSSGYSGLNTYNMM